MIPIKIKIHPLATAANTIANAKYKSKRTSKYSESEGAYHYEYHGEFIMQNGHFYTNPDYRSPKATEVNNELEEGWYGDEYNQNNYSEYYPQYDQQQYTEGYDQNTGYYSQADYYGSQQYCDEGQYNHNDPAYANSYAQYGENYGGSPYPGTEGNDLTKTRANTADYGGEEEVPTLRATDLHVNLTSEKLKPGSTRVKSPRHLTANKKSKNKAREVNPKRLTMIEQTLGLPVSNKKKGLVVPVEVIGAEDASSSQSSVPYTPKIILAAIRRGFAQEKFLILLIFTLIRWMLMILLFIYLMHYLASSSCRADEKCRGRVKSLASFNCFIMILHVLVGHRTLRLSTSLLSIPMQVQHYVKQMCAEPPIIQFRVTCYRHVTVDEIELSKIILHTESTIFWHDGFSDHTMIPKDIAEVVKTGNVLAVDSSTIQNFQPEHSVTLPCELFKIHGMIEYSFRDHIIQSEFAHDQQRFVTKHGLCDRHRKIEIAVSGPDFETRKVCCRDNKNLMWFVRYRFLLNAFLSILSVNWFFVVFLEGITAHIDIVFNKEIVQ